LTRGKEILDTDQRPNVAAPAPDAILEQRGATVSKRSRARLGSLVHEEENQMKQALAILAVVAALAVAAPAAAAAAKADGKTLFTQYKCNSCHAISAQGIAVIEEKGEEAEEEDDAATKPKDLSDVGTHHELAWFKDWLMKKVELDGKKHRKKFEFKGGELDTLTAWLATLKDAPKK
jgi:cytochrome c5